MEKDFNVVFLSFLCGNSISDTVLLYVSGGVLKAYIISPKNPFNMETHRHKNIDTS